MRLSQAGSAVLSVGVLSGDCCGWTYGPASKFVIKALEMSEGALIRADSLEALSALDDKVAIEVMLGTPEEEGFDPYANV